MIPKILDLFNIVPTYEMKLMKKAQNPLDVVAAVSLKLRPILLLSKPDVVIVQGDTMTALAAAMTSRYCGITVAHIEAGLRTYDKSNPFPEELNRQLITRLSDLHIAPTESARQNLLNEGVDENVISVTGNTGIDALLYASQKVKDIENFSSLQIHLKSSKWHNKVSKLSSENFSKLIFITMHRRESFGRQLESAFMAVRDLTERYPNVAFVFSVHPNPNVQKSVAKIFSNNEKWPNLYLCDPLDYTATVSFLKAASLIITDSGGLQEEGPALGIPILVTREHTEREEAIDIGASKLIGTEYSRILFEVSDLLDSSTKLADMANKGSPYGDGKASDRIVLKLIDLLRK